MFRVLSVHHQRLGSFSILIVSTRGLYRIRGVGGSASGNAVSFKSAQELGHVPQFSRRCSRRLPSIYAADIAHSKSRETDNSEPIAAFGSLCKWHFEYWQGPPYGFAIRSGTQHLTCDSTRPSVRITWHQRTPLHLTVFLRKMINSNVELRIRGNGELESSARSKDTKGVTISH